MLKPEMTSSWLVSMISLIHVSFWPKPPYNWSPSYCKYSLIPCFTSPLWADSSEAKTCPYSTQDRKNEWFFSDQPQEVCWDFFSSEERQKRLRQRECGNTSDLQSVSKLQLFILWYEKDVEFLHKCCCY